MLYRPFLLSIDVASYHFILGGQGRQIDKNCDYCYVTDAAIINGK